MLITSVSKLMNIHSLKDVGRNWTDKVTSEAHWMFFTCPPENECTNGHHDCDIEREICVDLQEGFRCECREGYKHDE